MRLDRIIGHRHEPLLGMLQARNRAAHEPLDVTAAAFMVVLSLG